MDLYAVWSATEGGFVTEPQDHDVAWCDLECLAAEGCELADLSLRKVEEDD